ncbi:MAG: shikimate dehydrogenase [Planctomycetales bacterium]|nr:shikimate dehydrogenase [Planctomycetales bacterium]
MSSKICVSIGRGRHKHMIAEHRHLVEQGASLVELRLDFIRRAVNLKRLIADRPCPTIVTVRRSQDGGRWEDREDARQILLRSAIADGVDYVDLEMDIAGSIPRFGKTKRIVSYHNFQETPENLEDLHRQMTELDPDIVKLATMAHHPQDNLRMLNLIQSSGVPTVGMCMGEIGTPSRILCGRYGAPFTYATFHHERALAPGQLSYRQMTQVYDFEQITNDTKLFGVVADPVAHSLSPLIHNAAFQHLGMDCRYLPFRVPREDLTDFVQRQCGELGVRGLSVTIPHKEAVLPLLTDAAPAVREVRACNTIVFDDPNRNGFNTDYSAAISSILAVLGESDDALKDRDALVLGAGGAASAIARALVDRGARVKITNRTSARAQQLAEQLSCRWIEWDDRHSFVDGILVNATPIGMHPNVDEAPFKAKVLDRKTIVFDTVYNPEQTLLIKEARAHGCRTITGVDMFVRQAAMQFKLFTGQEAPADVMRSAIHRAIGAAQIAS